MNKVLLQKTFQTTLPPINAVFGLTQKLQPMSKYATKLNSVCAYKVFFCHYPACLPAVCLEGPDNPEPIEIAGFPDPPIGVVGRQVRE